MPVSRALYVGQLVKITTSASGGANVFYFPVQSASCEVTKPIETISAFGRLNSLATAQVGLTTCKADIKLYLGTGSTGAGATTAITGFNAQAVTCLTGDAVFGGLTAIEVSPNGFSMSGILTSLGVSLDNGGFGMADLSFAGVGQPYFADPANVAAVQVQSPISLAPVTTMHAGGSITGAGCANSFKFNLDMPTETLSCLGSNVDEVQNTTMASTIATKPPYKATISVEGYGVDVGSDGTPLSTVIKSAYTLGTALTITLPNPVVTSKSFNNAVGAAGATYNYTIEDATAIFG